MAKGSPTDLFEGARGKKIRHSSIRPFGTSEIVDTALRVFQTRAGIILRLTAFPSVLVWATLFFASVSLWPVMSSGLVAGSPTIATVDLIVALLITVVIGLPIFCIGLAWNSVVIVTVTEATLLGNTVDADSVMDRCWSKVKSASLPIAWIVGALLLAALPGALFFGLASITYQSVLDREFATMAAGTLAFFATVITTLSCLFVVQKRALVPAVAIVEGLSPRSSWKRSKQLTRRHSGHPGTSATLFLVGTLLLFVGFPLWGSLDAAIEFSGLASWIGHQLSEPGVRDLVQAVLSAVPAYLALWLMSPLWTIACTVMYFDRIVRLEAFDVQLMLEDIKLAKRRTVLLR